MTTAAADLRERGFTIIEMIVVLVLLALAMATIFPSIGNMLRGSTRSAASAQATGEAGVVARQLENDLKVALGARGTGERTDDFNYSGTDAIRLATIPSLHAGSASTLYSDIVSAGPLEMTLNADVYERPGVEQVQWRLVENNPLCGDVDRANQNWCLQRNVRSPGGAGLLSVEVLTKGRGTYPIAGQNSCAPGIAAGKRLFCFQEAYPVSYTWNAGWTTACTRSWTAPGTTPNTALRTLNSQRFTTRHNAVDAVNSTSISRLDRILNVGVIIIAGGAYGDAGERSYENVEIAVRARENEAYREAIMCGTRAGWGR